MPVIITKYGWYYRYLQSYKLQQVVHIYLVTFYALFYLLFSNEIVQKAIVKSTIMHKLFFSVLDPNIQYHIYLCVCWYIAKKFQKSWKNLQLTHFTLVNQDKNWASPAFSIEQGGTH